MAKIRRAAFTLIELMLVIAIVGVLVAMMLPTVAQAWKLAAMTKCQVNLNRMWTAQNLRRADKDQQLFTTGGAWPAMLAPYLELNADVFKCPLGPDRPELLPMVTTDSQPYGDAGAVADRPASSTVSEKPRGFTLGDLTFRMYAKMDDLAGKHYGVGTYLGTVFLDGGFGVKKVDKGNGVTYIGVDDRMFFDDKNYGSVDYTDVQINVTMNGQYIRSIEFLDSDFKTGGSYSNIRFEVWLAGEMLSGDFVKDLGMIVGPDTNTGPASSGAGSGSANTEGVRGAAQAGSLNELAAIKSFDYALNKGSYLILDRWLGEVDPRAIFLMDYGKSIANYSNKSPDAWSLYFTSPEALWMANPVNVSFLKQGESWLKYTALRHFDMANVLFCDGHIETLGADALSEKSDLWGVVPW